MMEPDRVDGADSGREEESAALRGGEAVELRWERAVRYVWASMRELVPVAGVGSCRSDFFDIFVPFSESFVVSRSRCSVRSGAESAE